MQSLGKKNHSSVSEFILLGFPSEAQVRMALFAFFLLLYLITLLGNGLIIMLIYLDSHLHMPMYFFLSVLSLVDMSYVTTTVPQILVNMVCPRRTISWGACVAQMFIFLVLGIAECVLYAIMAYDRYVAISLYPTHEPFHLYQDGHCLLVHWHHWGTGLHCLHHASALLWPLQDKPLLL